MRHSTALNAVALTSCFFGTMLVVASVGCSSNPSSSPVTAQGQAGQGAAGASALSPGSGGTDASKGTTTRGGTGTAVAHGGAPVAESSGCTASALAPGDSSKMLDHGGMARQYLIHVPASYDGSKAVPLVVDMHGWTSNADQQKQISGWLAKSDKEGFVLLHPNGLNNSWNGGSLCCGTSQSSMVDDEGFMRAIVMETEKEGCVDSNRVYATGLSNGGAMSHLLACRAADLFAATAPVSMGNGTTPCQPSRPISVVMFRGTTDPLVPYTGGTFPSAQADFDQWKGLASCMDPPEMTHDGHCQLYSNCNAGVEVELCTVSAGHVLYSNPESLSVPDVVWETFARQSL